MTYLTRATAMGSQVLFKVMQGAYSSRTVFEDFDVLEDFSSNTQPGCPSSNTQSVF